MESNFVFKPRIFHGATQRYYFRLRRITNYYFYIFFFSVSFPCHSVVNTSVFNHGFFTEFHRDIKPPAAGRRADIQRCLLAMCPFSPKAKLIIFLFPCSFRVIPWLLFLFFTTDFSRSYTEILFPPAVDN